ncbi:MAG: hypothetical protein WCB75_03120, partial [Pseudolabrys sp.]
MTGALFEGGAYHKHKDPFDRVLGYIDFRKSILRGEVAEFTCLVGTMVLEVYESNPAIRDACDASTMSANSTFLAVFLGTKTNPRMAAWNAPSRSGTACEATRGDSGLEGVGRKTSSRNRRHGRTA